VNNDTGFFSALFDFSFRSFVTSKLVPVLYALFMIGAAIYALFIFITLAQVGRGAGIIFGLIAAPLVFLLAVLFGRVYLEVIVVLFRIAEDVGEIASQGRRTPPAV
jgi:hypothetical protein